MDAQVRRSSRRAPTLIALTVLACVSFLIALSGDSGVHSVGVHHRREFIVREDGFGRTTTTVTASSTSSAGSSTSSPSNTTANSINSTTASQSTSLSSTTSQSSTVSHPTSESTSTTSTEQTLTETSTEFTNISSTSTSSSSTKLSTSTTKSTTSTKRTTLSLIAAPTISPLSDISSPQPATTLDIPTNALQLPPIVTTTPIPSPASNASPLNSGTSESTAATTSGFWQNKGAVAATFVIVSLVFLAIVAVVAISYLKRRSARKQDLLHEELFEKFSDSGRNSPGLSINDNPMDPFATRDVVYSNPFYSAAERQRVVTPSIPVQHPDYYNQPATTTPATTSSARYLLPTNVQAARQATAPSAFRNPPVVRESYQQSIDSFYGGVAGQSSSSGYAL